MIPNPASDTDGRPEAAGGPDASREAMAAHGPALRRYLFGLCGCWHRADDLTQDVLLKAWRARDGFAARSSLRTWLFTIARNHWRDQLRRQKVRPESQPVTAETLTIPDSRPGPDRQTRRAEFAAAFTAALDHLPPEQREALALRESEGLSFAEAAEVLGVPVATVKSRVRYALLKLADLLAPHRQELER